MHARCSAKQFPIQHLSVKPSQLFGSSVTERENLLKDTHERSKRVEEWENGSFLSTNEKVRERGRETERRDGTGESLQSRSRQWLPGAQEFMVDLFLSSLQ